MGTKGFSIIFSKYIFFFLVGSGGSQPSSSFLTALMAFKSSAEGAGGGGKAAIALVVNQIDYVFRSILSAPQPRPQNLQTKN